MSELKNILIVEDEGLVAENLTRIIQVNGYTCVTVSSGEEAVDYTLNNSVLMVLMDIYLAGKIDGITACEIISERLFLPVIFITAFSDKELLARMKKLKPLAWIMKPFKEQEVIFSLEIAIERHRHEIELADSERRIKSIFYGAPDLIYSVNRHKKLSLINRDTEFLSEYGLPENFIIETLEERLSDTPPAEHDTAGGRFISRENRFSVKSQNGNEYWLELSSRIFITAEGSFSGETGIIRDISKRKQAEDAVNKMAMVDTLTGVYNRNAGMVLLEKEFTRTARSSSPFSVIYTDLDGLKYLNDTRGHSEGDSLIREFAVILNKTARESDTVFRLGGDEFLIILPDCSEIGAVSCISRITKEITLFNSSDIKPWQISASFGSASCTKGEEYTIDALIEKADAAMYADKKNRKNLAIF
jgi:diguanylate cyclase (GGDEF)-like protein/PAS domain S-box-containing protein